MRVLLDSNILLRMVEPGHAQHLQATLAVELLRRDENELCLVPQNLYEFWVVATRPQNVNGLGMSPSECDAAVGDILDLATLLRDERRIFEQWRVLVLQHETRGVKAHDARLAAAMFRHGISQILTFNASDFRRYEHVTALSPSEVTATP